MNLLGKRILDAKSFFYRMNSTAMGCFLKLKCYRIIGASRYQLEKFEWRQGLIKIESEEFNKRVRNINQQKELSTVLCEKKLFPFSNSNPKFVKWTFISHTNVLYAKNSYLSVKSPVANQAQQKFTETFSWFHAKILLISRPIHVKRQNSR